MKTVDHHRFDAIISLLKRFFPLVLIFVWAIIRPEQSADLIKITAAFLMGKSLKI